MRKFESGFRNGYEFYERYYDTELGKSVKKRIDLPFEWYVPSTSGLYSSILDENIKLEKLQGNAKDGRDKYGFLDPMYRNIRDNYWGEGSGYNDNPRIWYLDIETRVGQSFKLPVSPTKKITVINKKSNVSTTQTIVSLREKLGTFKCSPEHEKFFEQNTGFPVPEKAAEEITLMQFYDTVTDVMFVLGSRPFHSKREFGFNVKFIRCDSEIEILTNYIKIFKKLDPLIIYAWNGEGFDFPYIFNRMKNIGLDTNDLSNYGSTKLTAREFQGRMEFSFVADGHFYIDMLQVYKKFVLSPRSSYALDAIAEIELGENKVAHSEYPSFDDFYTGKNYIVRSEPYDDPFREEIRQLNINGEDASTQAYAEFVYYGAKDTYLIKRLDDKLNFTNLMNMIAERMGVLIGDSMGTVKPWSRYIANKSMLDNKVMPPRNDFEQPHVVGGYVRDPQKGKHNWVMSADVNSMYPMLGMVGFNMSPETYVPKHRLPPELRDIVLSAFNDQNEEKFLEYEFDYVSEILRKHNMTLGINGAVFTAEKIGMIPEMVMDIYSSRKDAKKKMAQYRERKLLIKELLSNENH